MPNPLVSIIIPTFNRAELLVKSVNSIINQTYTNWELFIVDDNSTDNTYSIVVNLARKDARIMYLKNQGMGGNAARNTGIKSANGNYVAFNDDDDIWLKDKLRKQVAILDKLPEEYGMLFCAYKRISKDEEKVYPVNLTEGNVPLKRVLVASLAGTPTILIKKHVLHAIGLFDVNLKLVQDWDVLLGVSRISEIYFLSDVLVEANVIGPRITDSHLLNRIDGFLYLIEKYWGIYKAHPFQLGKRYHIIGMNFIRLSKTSKGMRFILKSYVLNPKLMIEIPRVFTAIFSSK